MRIVLFLGILLGTICAHSQHAIPPDQIDPRIRKHYTDTEVQEMLNNFPAKIRQLNFYFQSSYIIVGPSVSREIDLKCFDVMDYEKMRKENERVIIGLTREGHILELLSIKELQEKYKTIQ